MALVVSQAGTQSWASTGTKSISVSVSAGDVLAFIVGAGAPATTVTNVTDNLGGTWTAGPSSPVSSGNMRGVTFWKVCSGSETSISFDIGTGTTGQAIAVRVTGFVNTATLEGTPDEDESKLSTTGKTVTSGSCSNTTATAVAIALFAADRADLVQDVSRAYSNSFTEVGFNSTSGSRGGAFAAALVLSSTGSQTTTFTTGDTGDEMYGAILVFGDASAGTNVNCTVEALTLAEYSATIGKSLNIAATADALTLAEYAATVSLSRNVAGTVEALTLAEYQATIGLALNVQATSDSLTLTEYAASLGSGLNISATVDALTLAEHAATIGLARNVQATVDSLTLTEYPASLGSTLDVQATTDALMLAEYPATLSFALNVSCGTDSLTLTEYAATVDNGAVIATPAPSGGIGHKKKKYPRRVYIDGRLYTVKSEADERRLLEQWRTQAQDAAAITENLGEKDLAQTIRKKAVRVNRRLAQLVDPLLLEDDELILMLYGGVEYPPITQRELLDEDEIIALAA